MKGLAVITFRLDPSSGVPTYLQLVQEVEHALRAGHLVPGDQLPLVREVVSDLAINPNTVLKAYRQLEGQGLTEGRPGVGTFVRKSLPKAAVPSYPALQRRMVTWIEAARRAGLDEQQMRSLFAATLRQSGVEGAA